MMFVSFVCPDFENLSFSLHAAQNIEVFRYDLKFSILFVCTLNFCFVSLDTYGTGKGPSSCWVSLDLTVVQQ